MNRSILICLLLIMACGQSCMKDKGNYDYEELNSITIDGMQQHYYAFLNRQLIIRPDLSFSKDNLGDDKRYKFEWIIDGMSGYSMGRPDTLSLSRDMDTILLPENGCADYKMYYRVTDTTTGIYSQFDFFLHVVTPSYEGWLLLCDPENGHSRLDMISRQGEKDTLYQDILKVTGSSFPAEGAPAFIVCPPTPLPPAEYLTIPIIATSNKATMLGMDTLEYKPVYELNNFMNGAKISSFAGARYEANLSASLLFAQDNVYVVNRSISTPINKLGGSSRLFRAAPYGALGLNGDCMLFDLDNNRLVVRSGDYCQILSAGTLFDYAIDNNVPGGMNLLFLGSITRTESETYIVMKAKLTGKCYLARCSADGSVQRYYSEMTGTDVEQAEYFAVDPEYGYVFYTVKGKVYEYDPVSRKSVLMKDYGSRKITVFKFQPFNFSDVYKWSRKPDRYTDYSALRRKLVVAHYEEGEPVASGVLDIYDVPSINRPLKLFRSYTGTGKVVSIGYRER